MLLFTVLHTNLVFKLEKKTKIFSHFGVQINGKKGNFGGILGHFGGHFERRPLFGIKFRTLKIC